MQCAPFSQTNIWLPSSREGRYSLKGSSLSRTAVKTNLCLKHKVIVLYLSERAVQVAGRWARAGYPPGKAGCQSPNRAAGRPHPSRLHSPPRRTSHSARRRLRTGTGKTLHLLASHCYSLHIYSMCLKLNFPNLELCYT